MFERHDAAQAFSRFLAAQDYPCVGAKSALHGRNVELVTAGDLRDATFDERILEALQAFPHEHIIERKFASLAVLFPQTPKLSELAFEQYLWERLSALHLLDAERFCWDDAVNADPESPDFGMSFGGHGFYVIGMHPGASRKARRAPCAALVFNSHAQFRLLRQAGLFDGIKKAVRVRDERLQGCPNPTLADHGERSEAPQYAGRKVERDWVCPFKRAVH